MYNIGLLKLYFKINNGTILLYFHNFLVTETSHNGLTNNSLYGFQNPV